MAILQATLQLLNNNLGVVTFLVGFFAIYLYIKQKVDRKRDAARLILQEIRYAEQQIRDSGRGSRGYSLASKLLPTNNWNDNIHLFTKDLKDSEIDMISRFYSQTTYIDSLIAERSKQIIHPSIMAQMQLPPTPASSGSVTAQGPAGNAPQQTSPQLGQMQITRIPTPGEEITNGLLREVSSTIEFLYNTPAAEKLRKISERKWYLPF